MIASCLAKLGATSRQRYVQSIGFYVFFPIQAQGLGFGLPPPPLGPLPGVKATRIWTILAWIQHLWAFWDGVREHALLLGRTEVSWHAKETMLWVAASAFRECYRQGNQGGDGGRRKVH